VLDESLVRSQADTAELRRAVGAAVPTARPSRGLGASALRWSADARGGGRPLPPANGAFDVRPDSPQGDDLVTTLVEHPERVSVDAVVTSGGIGAIPLFAALEDAQLAQVAQWFHVESASEGVTLVGESWHGYTFFVLADGTATVTSDGQTVASLEPGDFFGEIAIASRLTGAMEARLAGAPS
jgi:hypothetical protein